MNISRISHINKEKCMPWHRGAGTTAVLLLYHLAKLIDSHLATPHLKQGSHDGTYHITQETVGLNHKAPFMFAHLLPSGLHDATVVGSHVGM